MVLKICERLDLHNAPIETIYNNIRIYSVKFECKTKINTEKPQLLYHKRFQHYLACNTFQIVNLSYRVECIIQCM